MAVEYGLFQEWDTDVVEITKVNMADMPKMTKPGKPGHAEFNAVRALDVDEAISFPCRWLHSKSGTCNAVQNIYAIQSRTGHAIRSVCHEGTVYVGRTA